ncbi:uncharacterized protein LOC130013600 [Patella vulgata]|uniref:uncharacterized protein LOC130010694 n=1 Tax=Patella vulgata TaxID=6465 RepID=UPI0024A83C33|nr:uncharacterized protein LOC130010694 [Patella vulgata]XP_055955869.1 uncharacterized protein LOC130012297 [Patella vulgata]XP_055956141.1 uncharacterized protein LOC130012365 [Patella vulgata]XP_055956767.1 uncharacterized protein LOC130012828 [Patella vulgata]XP_055957478.1 uncharacterized protein LOC130013060 [Patella vulgata]XP_055958345.1 uncharacterized protein LOC130013600 [Patella vulgata]XP_055958346.1 uncharacterized protein LOC130013600 [Patella vulgata]
MSEEEVVVLGNTLRKLGLFPKRIGKTEDDVAEWMEDVLKSKGKWPVKSDDETESSTKSRPPVNPMPKLSMFYGEPGKGEVSYDLWRYEVDCLISEGVYDNHVILLAIRRSLKGEAGKVIMRLGPHVDVKTVLAKLHSVYGTCEEAESLIGLFYSAKQYPSETVTDWACRLEDIFARVTREGSPDPKESDETLRNVFWRGLLPHLRDLSAHKYDKSTSFDTLRVQLRRIEHDVNQRNLSASTATSKPNPFNMIHTKSSNSEFQELKGIVHSISSQVSGLKDQVSQLAYKVDRPKVPRWQSQGNDSRGSLSKMAPEVSTALLSLITGPTCRA